MLTVLLRIFCIKKQNKHDKMFLILTRQFQIDKCVSIYTGHCILYFPWLFSQRKLQSILQQLQPWTMTTFPGKLYLKKEEERD